MLIWELTILQAQWLTRVHHGNLTSILGYCDEDTHLGLVYEHMENGNLADHLSGTSNDEIQKWKKQKLFCSITILLFILYLQKLSLQTLHPPIYLFVL